MVPQPTVMPMPQRFVSISGIAKCGVIALVLLGLFMAGYLPTGGHVSQGDDWRRTTNGWQRMSQWQIGISTAAFEAPPVIQANQRAETGRFDTHPAVLALLQLVATLLALYAFPFRSTPSPPLARHLPTLLARSFRASAFGS